ncbi:MAG: hypothetical protein E7424_02195 [Ruminococcaceae bacterium]|nr:hypothetical protein [Oscillospiraceae bacterium]
MKNDVYTQSDLRRFNILTTDYVLNLEPGDFFAVLDLKAEARRCLRAFFTFNDGRRIMSTVHWWQCYLGIYDIPSGSRVKLHYDKNSHGEVYLTAVERLHGTVLSSNESAAADSIFRGLPLTPQEEGETT